MNIQLTQLIEKARQYAKVLKDFQEVNLYILILNRFLFIFRQYVKMKCLQQNLNEQYNLFILRIIDFYLIKFSFFANDEQGEK